MRKIILISLAIASLVGCNEDLESIRNCVVLKQHCGFDGLDNGYYQVRDLSTGVVRRVDVDIKDCDVYAVGDTIP